MVNLQVSLDPTSPCLSPTCLSKALRKGFSVWGCWGQGAVLWLAFSREVCAWQGQQQLWDMLVGAGEARGRGCGYSCLPRILVLILQCPGGVVVCKTAPHGTQRPLSSAVSHSSTSQVWSVQVHARWTQVCTHDHYHRQKTRNQGLGAT